MDQTNYQYRIQNIQFANDTNISPGKLTLLIGPNNVGKSRALKEIAAFATQMTVRKGIVVSAISAKYPSSLTELRKAYDVERYQDAHGFWHFNTLATDLVGNAEISGGADWPLGFEELFKLYTGDRFNSWFAGSFGPALVAFLTTDARLKLVEEGQSSSEEREASSLLQLLYNAGSAASHTVSKIVKSAFDKEMALDFTIPQKLSLRVADDFSKLPADPRDARPFMLNCEQLDEQGDGIRSFVGIMVALMTLKRSLFLIDEPEAFLHPPQAFRLGSLIAEQSDKNRQIIVATHSVDVLRGILSRTTEAQIVRIDRIGRKNTINLLDPQRLKEIITDPLLTSSRVLDGLFYSGAFVVEADSDARFYHAVSMKLRADRDFHFVNADNKQTVPRIARLYADLGVHTAGVVDFDVLSDRAELEKSLKSIGFEENHLVSLVDAQRKIAQAVRELPSDKRLSDISDKLTEIRGRIEELAAQVFCSPDEEKVAKDHLLLELEGRFKQMAEMGKAWKPT